MSHHRHLYFTSISFTSALLPMTNSHNHIHTSHPPMHHLPSLSLSLCTHYSNLSQQPTCKWLHTQIYPFPLHSYVICFNILFFLCPFPFSNSFFPIGVQTGAPHFFYFFYFLYIFLSIPICHIIDTCISPQFHLHMFSTMLPHIMGDHILTFSQSGNISIWSCTCFSSRSTHHTHMLHTSIHCPHTAHPPIHLSYNSSYYPPTSQSHTIALTHPSYAHPHPIAPSQIWYQTHLCHHCTHPHAPYQCTASSSSLSRHALCIETPTHAHPQQSTHMQSSSQFICTCATHWSTSCINMRNCICNIQVLLAFSPSASSYPTMIISRGRNFFSFFHITTCSNVSISMWYKWQKLIHNDLTTRYYAR